MWYKGKLQFTLFVLLLRWWRLLFQKQMMPPQITTACWVFCLMELACWCGQACFRSESKVMHLHCPWFAGQTCPGFTLKWHDACRQGHDVSLHDQVPDVMQATFFIALAVASRMGTAALAAHQIVAQLWLLTSYVTDGFAVAGTVLGSRLSHQRLDPASNSDTRYYHDLTVIIIIILTLSSS